MSDIDLGALKFKIGLDDSMLDKQVKDIQNKLQNTFNQEVSFQPLVSQIDNINKTLSEVSNKLNDVNKRSSDIGKKKTDKKMDMLVQMETLSEKITEATREYERLDKVYRNVGNAGGDKGMSTRKTDLENQKKVIEDLVAELNRLKIAYSLTANSVPKMSIADERELNLLRQQYELEIAKTKEMDRQAAKQEQANKKIQSNNQKYLQYLSGQSGLALGMPEGSAEDLNKKIAAIQKRLELLNSFKTTVSVNSNQITKADTLIQKLQAKMEKLSASLRKSSTEELLNINPTSINQANNLISELTNRRNILNITDANYNRTLTSLNRRIQEHNKFINETVSHGIKLQETNQKNTVNSKEFTEELTKQNRMMREFVNTIKTYAGFYFFRDMFQELVNIRGEFELQQVSLRAIIQDARRADQIFGQIKSLAVISPFQFSDLVSYTKQLAAFQIPVNELYGTMKSLADVSSGLGVDMGRIILAYGQIRSAGVLRGQELRQLTEAGIPALESLRKKMEEVRGTTQNTDDVFDAISKRQIPFEYIKEMFTTMTEDGGMFYKMQEIQAASLKGMISNLADSYQIMMNNIGEANDSTLKGIVGGITSAMENWRYFAKAIEGVAVAYAALMAVQLARTAMLGKEVIATTNALRAEKLREAQLLRQASMYRTLTVAERWKISSSTQLSAVEIAAAVNSGKMTAEMAKRILATNMLTQAERQLLVTELGLSGAEAARFLSMTKGDMLMNRFKLATFGLTNAFKSLWLTIKANPLMVILTVAGLVAEAFHIMSARTEEFNQRIKDSAKSFRESYSDLQKDLDKINFDKLTPENLEQLDSKQLKIYENSLTDILSKYGNMGQYIIQDSNKIDDQKSRVEYLQKSVSELKEAYKLAAQNADMLFTADKATKRVPFGDLFSEMLKDYEGSAVKLTSAGKNIEEFRGQIVQASREIISMGRGTKEWRNELTELINSGKSAATIVEKIRSLAETSGDSRTFEIFKNKTHFDSEELLKQYDTLKLGIIDETKELELSFALFAKSAERELKKVFGNIDVKNMAEAEKNQLKIQIENFAIANEYGENARKKLNELVEKEWNIKMDLDDEEAKDGLIGWKKSLDEITGHKWTISIKANDVQSMEDFFKQTKKEYKDAKESITNLQNTIDKYVKEGKVKKLGDEYKLTGIVGPEEAESINKTVNEINSANESMEKATGTAKQFNLELEKQKKGKRDPLADLWKNRLSLLESAYSKFKDLSINIGKEEAKKQVNAIYGPQALKLGVEIVYDKQTIADNYSKAAKELEKRVPQDAAKNAQKAAELSSEIYIESAQKVMKKITDEFDRYKNKYDFYQDILGITGDSNLAIDLSVQYSGDASNMAENFAAGIYNNMQNALAGMNLDLGISIIPDTNSFTSMNEYINQIQEALKSNNNIGKDQKEMIQNMVDAWKGYFGEMAKQYANDIAEYGNYYDQTRAIEQKYAKRISTAKGVGNTSLANALKKSEQMELMKLTTDYQNFYGAIESMSIEAATRVSSKIREMLTLNFQAGSLTAKQYQQEIKRVNDQLDSLYNRRSDTSVLISDGIEASLQNRITGADAETTAALIEEQQLNAEIAEERNKYNIAIKEGNMAEAYALSAKIQQLEVQKAETKETYKTNVAISESTRKMQQMVKDALKLGETIQKWGKLTTDSINGVANMINSFGGDSSGLTEVSSAVDDVVGGVGSIMQGFASGGWAGAAIAAVGAVSNVIAGFSERHDARLQKHIENLQFESKKLSNIYDMLEKEFEHVINPENLDKVTSEQVANLQEQLRIQKEILASEEDKKKSDRDKVEDYKQNIKELEYEVRYYTETLANDLYAIDLKGWAAQFADALVGAWSKGESAAEAYKNTVADVMKDVVKNWIQQQYIEKALTRVQTSLFGSNGTGGMFSDNKLDQSEIANLGSLMGELEASMTQGNDVWNQLNEALGGILSETEENENGLSNAISGVDENTFNQALGYINGIRYEMIVQSDLLRQLVSLNGGTVETGGVNMTAIQQSQLDILSQQLAATLAIKTALLSVISISPNGGGSAMKVIIT